MSKTLADIGEFGLIHRIHELLKKEGVQAPDVTLGIGDDTASYRPRKGYEQLITCDCVVEGRHYLSEFITPLDLGRRAMTMNLSDIGALGGKPLYALVSLGLKDDMLVSDVEDIYLGFIMELNPFSASIIGGNVTKTMDATFIDITLIGEVEKDKITRRSTARVGDTILVTGYPGQAAAGLRLMRQSKPTKELIDHPLVRAFNTPSHRVIEGQAVADSMLASAMIDTSDGFLGDLGHICQESGVGATLIQEQFPISEILRQTAEQLQSSNWTRTNCSCRKAMTMN
jgi:thiamine-monophosphate kinase